jgi:signal transduction histidine kinase
MNADEDKLHQMILNVGRNAVEAMPNGGTLSIKAYGGGDQALLVISDTGCGIPEDIDIFRPFTTSKSQGVGLGLHIVRQIVSVHQGVITYKTMRGAGTTFEISLPKIQKDHGLPA